MKHYYEIFENGFRVGTGMRVELAELKPGQSIKIYDSMNLNKEPIVFNDSDEFLGWLEAQARAFAWADKADRPVQQLQTRPQREKVEWNPLEETNGFQVKQQPVDNNLKTAAAINKPRISAVPPIALMALGAAMQEGCNKYGLFNWRDSAATSTVFYDAIQRHLLAWYSGEDYAQDSHVHHLAHIMGSCAILLDAELHGVLNDDRDKSGHKVTPAEMGLIKEG